MRTNIRFPAAGLAWRDHAWRGRLCFCRRRRSINEIDRVWQNDAMGKVPLGGGSNPSIYAAELERRPVALSKRSPEDYSAALAIAEGGRAAARNAARALDMYPSRRRTKTVSTNASSGGRS
jgi:hypothetical protein